MQDFKCYLPHHREQHKQLVDGTSKAFILALIAGMIWLMCMMFVDALDRTAQIESAVAAARQKERERIYTANQDILKGHEEYRQQMDALIDKAYRQGR